MTQSVLRRRDMWRRAIAASTGLALREGSGAEDEGCHSGSRGSCSSPRLTHSSPLSTRRRPGLDVANKRLGCGGRLPRDAAQNGTVAPRGATAWRGAVERRPHRGHLVPRAANVVPPPCVPPPGAPEVGRDRGKESMMGVCGVFRSGTYRGRRTP
ncbi:hypothetical protein E2C01_060177 [Portunus trituberculatus]|uniref:Uncharacterized protein n=1 Tax=Portunus trituberculatus TaxID=210409 RepID=A0A5B7HBB7_PORTR|nr:hypothetical protein [Portunus trituberculatus]